MKQVLSSCSASISELKKNPTALLNEAEGSPIADRKSTRLNSSHIPLSRMPSSP